MIVDRGIEGNLNFSQCQYHDQQNRRICKCNMHMVVSLKYIFVMRCAIWYHLYNFKNVKNTHGGVSLLVKVAGFTTTSNTHSTILKLCKWYQIVQPITFKQSLQ